MYQRSFFNVLLFFASMIITGALLFGISACTPHQEKKAAPPQTAKAEPAPLPPITANLPLSVDFDNVALSEVAQFVTSQTGKGLILSGNEAKPVTWIESKLTKETLFDSFKATLTASGLVLKSANDQESLFSIEQPEEAKTPVLLDYARSSKGVFLLLGSTIYPLQKFPYPVRYDSGHWYALLPKSISDQKKSGSENEKI
ncbi:MAG: hypothetical protein PHI97_32760 [Desulfobulbus sp.]|nr:hypothetical protein [Desulfobulbus sp.]